MLIVSKHKDFYDGIFSGEPDKSIVYNRTLEELTDQRFFSSKRSRWSDDVKQYKYTFPLLTHTENHDRQYRRNYTEHQLCLLGFCGKTYIFSRKKHSNIGSEWEYVWDKSEIIRNFTDEKSYYYNYRKEELINLFNEWNGKMKYDIFRELGCPVFMFTLEGRTSTLTINPILKDIDFHKVLNPFSVAQDIYMFVDTQLRPKEELIEISDKDKAKSRGFTDMSFKNRGKSPKRRKHRK